MYVAYPPPSPQAAGHDVVNSNRTHWTLEWTLESGQHELFMWSAGRKVT